jgi:mannosyl-oligosaccharide alpha-1,2-mannosidase
MNELEKWQSETSLPGMWPAVVDSTKVNHTIALGTPVKDPSELYTLGALADSAYEYLPKVTIPALFQFFISDLYSNI